MEITAKENMLLTDRRPKSRNATISKSSTTFLRLHPNKLSTPLKLLSQETSKNVPSNTVNKGMMKQILALKKENAELVRLLKKSKGVFETELGSYKTLVKNMRNALGVTLPIIEAYGDENMKGKVKEVLSQKYLATKKENCNESKGKCKDITKELSHKNSEVTTAQAELGTLKGENACFRKYFNYIKRGAHPAAPKKPPPGTAKVLPTFVRTMIIDS